MSSNENDNFQQLHMLEIPTDAMTWTTFRNIGEGCEHERVVVALPKQVAQIWFTDQYGSGVEVDVAEFGDDKALCESFPDLEVNRGGIGVESCQPRSLKELHQTEGTKLLQPQAVEEYRD